MPPVDGTYAPRSPDLSTFSSSANQSNQTSNQANANTNAYPYTGAYQALRSNSTAQNQPQQPLEREEGYTPRSPKIPRYDFTSTEPPAQTSTDTRRTSVYQPPISPQYQQGYRRHSTYQPPILDPPPAHTNSTWRPFTHTSTSYTSPIYARNSTTSLASQPHHQPLSYPPRGSFSQAQRSGFSIPQSALTYQSPAYSQPHSQPHLHPPVEVKRELVDINLLTHAKSAPSAPQSVISPTGTNSAHPFSSLKLEDSTTSVKGEDRDNKMADIKTEMNGDRGLDAGLGASKGIEVKTKFPVARIKRIMQADEEVGKVAQVTPVVVCKYPERTDGRPPYFS